MQQFVLEEALANHDDDKDGKFSFKEFVAFEDGNLFIYFIVCVFVCFSIL